MWVLYDGNQMYWNKADHCWSLGIENATKYTDEERSSDPYPRIKSTDGDVTWEQV